MDILRDIEKLVLQKKLEKNHIFFTKFNKNFSMKIILKEILIFLKNVSDDKYLKLYKIKSNLVDYNTDVLESSLNFTSESSKILFWN